MSAINYLTLRSTLFYSAGSAGTLPPGSSIITTDPNGLQVATNNIKINTATYSTLLGSSVTVSSITAPAILGTTTLGQNASYPNRYVEMGTDQTNSMYLDFHSNDSALPDYSTRIQSLGGGTTGTGIMNLYASTIGLMGTAGVGIGKTNPAYALDVTGTVNISGSYYVNGAPMSSSQWTTSGSLIYYNGGNVGIGTTGPTNLLTVTQLGSSYTKPVLVLDAGIPANASAGAPRGIGSPLLGIGALSYTTGGVAGDYYGIGFGYGGHIAGNYYPAEIGFYVQNTGGAEWGDIVFSTRNVTTNTVVSERMRITGSGNVGIGTTSPSTVLHLYGSSTGYTNGIMTITNSNTNPQGCFNVLGPSMSTGNNMLFNIGQSLSGYNAFGLLFGYVGAGSTSNYFLLSAYGNGNGLTVQGSGNVGIGKTTPATTLDVQGSAYIGNAVAGGTVVTLSTGAPANVRGLSIYYNSGGTLGSATGDYSVIQSGYGGIANTPIALNPGGGNVGIGVTAPSYQLQLSKSILAKNLNHMNWNMNAMGYPGTPPGSALYWNIATLGPTGANSSLGQLSIKGSLGGYVVGLKDQMSVDIVFMTRGGVNVEGIIKTSNYAGAVALMDLQYWVDGSGKYQVYLVLKLDDYYSFDLDVGSSGSQSAANCILYDPSVVTPLTTAPGTMVSLTASCQMVIQGSNVGIGRINPASALDVAGTVTASAFSAPTGNYLNIYNGAGSGSISLQGGSILFQNSYVGIGTTNPTNPLHIYTGNASPFVMEQSSTTANYMTFKTNGTVYGFFGLETSAGGGLFGSNTGYGMSIGTPTATNFNIATNNAVRATVTSSGNVGIGITTPGYLLTVGAIGNPSANNAGTTMIQSYGNINLARNRIIFSNAGNDWNHCIYNAYYNMDNEGVWDGMKFNVYNGAWFRVGQASGSVPTTAMFINSTGSVGIGMTTPAATLDVNGTIVAGNNTGGLSIKNASGVVKNLMTLDTSNVLRIQGGGGVMYINNDNTASNVYLNYASAAAFNVYNGTNLTMTCSSTGTNVGIGTGTLTASTLTVYPSITVTGQSFVVGGSAGTFYPVLIDTTPSWTSTNIYKITISRSEVHLDSTWKGSMTFILEGHITAWGNGADYSRYKFVGSNTGTPTWTNFIANYIEDPTSRFVVVMLRGLTTYYFSGEGCTLNNGNGSGTSLTIPGGNNSVYASTTTISPPFDGTYAFGDNRDNLFGKNGYVGIGTNNPNTLLHVNGSINCSGLVVNGTSVATGTGSVWSVSGSTIMYTSGNVGIGVASPANTLDIQGAVRSGTHATGRGLYVTMDNYDSSNGFEFRHSNGSQGIGIGYNSIYATGYNVNQDLNLFPRGTGKVGIFTTNPGATLHIYQNINGAVNQYIQNVSAGSSAFSQTWLANDSGSGGGMFLNSSTRSADGGVNTMTVRNDAGDLRLQAKGGTLGIHVLSTSGFVGIGITNPQAPLHVGTLASNGASGSSAINYGGIGPGYITSWNGTAGVLNGGTAGSRAAGATGIFSMNDVVTGNNLIAMDFISFSDARIKKNISTFGRSALELIHKVRIVSYDHIDFKKSSCAAGIIAQEIEEVFPECIKQRKDVVPNIYRPAIHSRVDDHIRLQLVDENGLAISRANPDVLNAKRVSLRIYRDNQEHHFDVDVYETNGSLFHVSSWSDYTEADEVFVFGTEVEDFRVIDKEMVAMVGIKAIQDVDTKVIALEQENAMLKSQLASLLQWAQQQGYKA